VNEEKKPSKAVNVERGLYIVLFICVAIVGIASWALINRELNLPKNTEAMGYVTEPTETKSPSVQSELNDVIKTAKVKPTEDKAETEQPETVETPEVIEQPEVEQPEAVETTEEKSTEAPTETPKAPPKTQESAAPKFVWPLSGAVEVSYSMDELIFDKTMADWRTHDGIDLEAKQGTRVLAAADGVVERVYDDEMYGTTVILSHSGGLKTVYSNLAGTPTVRETDSVKSGAVIGSVGNTAAAETGQVSHLHFAMTKDGESVDPSEFMPER